MNYRIIYLILILFFSVSIALANGLDKIVQQSEKAADINTHLKLAKECEQIALTEKKNWQAYYWVAFNYTAAAKQISASKKDSLLDIAIVTADVAQKLKPNEPEIMLLKSWIYSEKIMVNPQKRIREFGPKANEYREKAFVTSPNNPRYYFLKGSFAFYSPPSIGGGKQSAKKYFQQALSKYNIYKKKNDLYPNWGKEETQKMLKACQ